MPKDKDIEPIDASLDDVANSLINPAPSTQLVMIRYQRIIITSAANN